MSYIIWAALIIGATLAIGYVAGSALQEAIAPLIEALDTGSQR